MKRVSAAFTTFAAGLLGAIAMSGSSSAASLSEPMLLVASSNLDGSAYERTVVIATPLADGGHIGFIVNKPIGVKLEALFPDDAAAREVKDSAYVGGPALGSVMFAVTRNAPERPELAIALMPDLFAVVDRDAIDHIIRTTPNEARYFLGVMVWKPGDLANEVDGKVWDVRPASADMVLRAKSRGLWDSLRGTWASLGSDRLRVSHTRAG